MQLYYCNSIKMPKEVPPIATDAVKPAVNMTIIYIAIIICIVIVGSYFMYMVYKKLKTLNDDIVEVSKKNNTLDTMVGETKKYMDTVNDTMEILKNKSVAEGQNHNWGTPVGTGHAEKMFVDEENDKLPALEDITEQVPDLHDQD